VTTTPRSSCPIGLRTLAAALRADYAASQRSTNVLRILVLYRISHLLYEQPPSRIRLVFLFLVNRIKKWLVFYPFHIDLPDSSHIGPGLRLPHPHGIILSGHSTLGPNCTLFHNVTLGVNEHRDPTHAPTLGENVYVGVNACLIGGINVGDGTTIGANSTLTTSAAPHSVVVGTNRFLSGGKHP
jgi:serine O-acetyltransferase